MRRVATLQLMRQAKNRKQNKMTKTKYTDSEILVTLSEAKYMLKAYKDYADCMAKNGNGFNPSYETTAENMIERLSSCMDSIGDRYYSK